jgi:hypothetical protein
LPARRSFRRALYWHFQTDEEIAMQQPTMASGSDPGAPGHAPVQEATEEPQRRERERSGILGEPAGVPPADAGDSDGSERGDPLHEQVPDDGKDHWRR